MSVAAEIIIKARAAVSQATSEVKAFFGRIKDSALGIGRNLMNIKAGFDMLAVVARQLWGVLERAFEFERYNTQFKVLLGNIDDARKHMADLAQFSASTPFELPNIARASRTLLTATGGVLGFRDSLRMVGDAAAATNSSIEEVSMWVGRAYSSIAAGRPFGEAAMRLQELGILSGDTRNKLERLQETGAKNIEIWRLLEGELNRFKGGMEELSKTGDGLTSTLRDNVNLALADVGAAFQDAAKVGIKELADRIDELRKNGDIAAWAARVADALGKVAEAAVGAVKGISWLIEKSRIGDVLKMAGAGITQVSTTFGALSGGATIKEAVDAGIQAGADVLSGESAARKEQAARIASLQRQREQAGAATTTGPDTAAKIEADMLRKQEEVDAAKYREELKKAQERVAKAEESNALAGTPKDERLGELRAMLQKEQSNTYWETPKEWADSMVKQLELAKQIQEVENKLAEDKKKAIEDVAAAERDAAREAAEDRIRAAEDVVRKNQDAQRAAQEAIEKGADGLRKEERERNRLADLEKKQQAGRRLNRREAMEMQVLRFAKDAGIQIGEKEQRLLQRGEELAARKRRGVKLGKAGEAELAAAERLKQEMENAAWAKAVAPFAEAQLKKAQAELDKMRKEDNNNLRKAKDALQNIENKLNGLLVLK